MTDKTQRIIFIVLPFAFVPFIVNFPVGLLLYWVTTNLWTVGQGLDHAAAHAQAAGAAEAQLAHARPRTLRPRRRRRPRRPRPSDRRAASSGERRVRRRKKRGPQTRR